MPSLNQIQLSRSALSHNLQALRQHVGPGVTLAPCVKANAYGHGLTQVAPVLIESGADWLCVNSVEEAELLRDLGVQIPLLVIGYVPDDLLGHALTLDLRLLVTNRQTIERLAALATQENPARLHLKVDTGMSRQGIYPEQVMESIEWIQKQPTLQLEGIATHFATADEPHQPAYYQTQKARFQKLIGDLETRNLRPPLVHCANSATTLLDPEMHLDMVRPGIACYGMWPSAETKDAILSPSETESRSIVSLQPALSLSSRIAYVKELKAGASVSYGASFTADHDMRIAVLPIGYYDGVDRGLSNRGHVLIQGKPAPILGRVCMNITIVDVTHHDNPQPEDEVVLLGSQGSAEVTTEDWASWAGTINYEITTRLRETMQRVVTP